MHVRYDTRWLWIAVLLVALFGTIPAAIAFADTGGSGEVEFLGVIRSLPDTTNWIGDWVVNMRTVHVTSTTTIDQTRGPVMVGAYVKVKGTPQHNGSINATKIEVIASPGSNTNVRFFGVVKTLPTSGLIGDWTVQIGPLESMLGATNLAPTVVPTQTVTVHVISTTRIITEHGSVQVGAFVRVEGSLQNDRSVNASEIEVKAVPPPPGNRVEFFGRIESLPSTTGWIGDWKVSGRTVHVSNSTRIDQTLGQVQVGAFVKVVGTARADHSVDATGIVVRANPPPPPPKYIRFYGIVQVLPTTTGWIGDWKVSGITVHVTKTTRIVQQYGAPAVGKPVEVKGLLQNDGSVNAVQIETKRAVTTTNTLFGKASAFSQSSQ